MSHVLLTITIGPHASTLRSGCSRPGSASPTVSDDAVRRETDVADVVVVAVTGIARRQCRTARSRCCSSRRTDDTGLRRSFRVDEVALAVRDPVPVKRKPFTPLTLKPWRPTPKIWLSYNGGVGRDVRREAKEEMPSPHGRGSRSP